MGSGGEVLLSTDWKVLPYRDLPGGGGCSPCELAEDVEPVSLRGTMASIVARRSCEIEFWISTMIVGSLGVTALPWSLACASKAADDVLKRAIAVA